jgi:hypothetical protein
VTRRSPRPLDFSQSSTTSPPRPQLLLCCPLPATTTGTPAPPAILTAPVTPTPPTTPAPPRAPIRPGPAEAVYREYMDIWRAKARIAQGVEPAPPGNEQEGRFHLQGAVQRGRGGHVQAPPKRADSRAGGHGLSTRWGVLRCGGAAAGARVVTGRAHGGGPRAGRVRCAADRLDREASAVALGWRSLSFSLPFSHSPSAADVEDFRSAFMALDADGSSSVRLTRFGHGSTAPPLCNIAPVPRVQPIRRTVLQRRCPAWRAGCAAPAALVVHRAARPPPSSLAVLQPSPSSLALTCFHTLPHVSRSPRTSCSRTCTCWARAPPRPSSSP